MASFDLSKPNRTIHLGIILLSSHMEFLDVAPVDMLHGFNPEWVQTLPIEQRLKDQAMPIEFHWINENGGPLGGLTSGAKVQVTDSFETCPPLDIALIGAGTPGYEANEAELAFIRRTFEQCSSFLTVCGGIEYAVKAGITRGLRATAPRFILPMYRQAFADTEWTDRRWEHDGKLWSSGAFINGLDMMREYIEHTWGGEGSLARFLAEIGSAPVRDRDYRDDKFELSGFAMP